MGFTTLIIQAKTAKLTTICALALIIISNTPLLTLYATRLANIQSHSMSETKERGEDWLKENCTDSILEPDKKTIRIPPNISSTRNSLAQDMKRCSIAMGMDRNRINHTHLNIVATNTQKLLEAVQSILPRTYLPNLMNPCWYSNITVPERVASLLKTNLNSRSSRLSKESIANVYHQIFDQPSSKSKPTMYCLPAFFIGGFPKSGTSSLHYALKQHSTIQSPTIKEPHWWTRIPLKLFNDDYLKVIFIRYLLYFSKTSEQIVENPNKPLITYDGSTSTIWDTNLAIDDQDYCAMPTLMSRIFPRMKMIILMRDPIDRLYSDYYFHCSLRYGHNISTWPEAMQKDPVENFHQRVTSDIMHFNKCLSKKWSHYECANKMRSRLSKCAFVGEKLMYGMYSIHLQKWMHFYPKDNFLFLTSRDLSRNPYETFTKTVEFLGIDAVNKKKAESWLSAHQNVQRAVPLQLYQMYNKSRKILNEFYQPFNEQFKQLMGSKAIQW